MTSAFSAAGSAAAAFGFFDFVNQKSDSQNSQNDNSNGLDRHREPPGLKYVKTCRNSNKSSTDVKSKSLHPVDQLTAVVQVFQSAIANGVQQFPAAVKIFEVLGCQDMARVDFRVDESGEVYFLEINPLPSFAPDGSLGLLAEYLGVSYSQLVGRILDAAIERIGRTSLRLNRG